MRTNASNTEDAQRLRYDVSSECYAFQALKILVAGVELSFKMTRSRIDECICEMEAV